MKTSQSDLKITLSQNTKSKFESLNFKYYTIIVSLFISTWLISNIAAVKLVLVFGLTLTGGFIIFPFTTMLGTIIVEVYGYKNSRQAIWSGFLLNLTFIFFINLVNTLPSSPAWKLQAEFSHILVPSYRIIFASLISLWLSDFFNSYLMAKLKIKSNGKSLINRILLSYSISITLDIFTFIFLAFAGIMPNIALFQLFITAYFKKIICQLILLPASWIIIIKLKKTEKLEIFDTDTIFTPFSLENIYDLDMYRNNYLNENKLKKNQTT